MKILCVFLCLMAPSWAYASCHRASVCNDYGQACHYETFCENAFDSPSFEPAATPSFVTPSFKPFQPAIIPPMGATSCQMTVVGGRWQNVCR